MVPLIRQEKLKKLPLNMLNVHPSNVQFTLQLKSLPALIKISHPLKVIFLFKRKYLGMWLLKARAIETRKTRTVKKKKLSRGLLMFFNKW